MIEKKKLGANKIDAAPAKRFFVEMLTRDIELEDAILDLLDNCLDGAVRLNAVKGTKPNAKQPYKGYWAKITLDADHFRIEDNCGGIPLELARHYAFRFGRPDTERDKNLNTVGVYGIGMKRALFKLGSDCHVRSTHVDGSFGVHIDEAWIAGEDWELDLNRKVETPKKAGVVIEVSRLLKYLPATEKSALPMVIYPLVASEKRLVGRSMRSNFCHGHHQNSISAAC